MGRFPRFMTIPIEAIRAFSQDSGHTTSLTNLAKLLIFLFYFSANIEGFFIGPGTRGVTTGGADLSETDGE
jgi:hypothetical protein